MPNSPDFKYNKSIGDLFKDARKPIPPAETGWWNIGASEDQGIAFQNSWDNAGSPARYHLSEHGDTRLDGKVFGGANNTVMFILPEEARPQYDQSYACTTEDADGNRGFAIVDVLTDGSVVYIGSVEALIGAPGSSGGIDGGSP
jgi:hypothetical protein